MSQFIQLHFLTSYPPSNPNRDDLGRPKTAVMGGVPRMRISSQSLKRAWRTSDIFEQALKGHIGTRTKEMGKQEVYPALVKAGVKEKDAKAWAQDIARQFGKLKAANKNDPMQELEIEQLAHFSPEERAAIGTLVETLAKKKRAPTEDELKLLRKEHSAADIALFGRMLADATAYNVEAAAQVAHAITVHGVAVEDDFFTAVDDLNRGEEDVGAGHMGETEFGAGVFYLYVCVNRSLLEENLGGDRKLANQALRAFTEAAAKVAPSGKQNSFGSRVYASYLLAERGAQQPRSLSVAFLEPVKGANLLTAAIERLESTRDGMDKVYGACSDAVQVMNASEGKGKINDILDFVVG